MQKLLEPLAEQNSVTHDLKGSIDSLIALINEAYQSLDSQGPFLHTNGIASRESADAGAHHDSSQSPLRPLPAQLQALQSDLKRLTFHLESRVAEHTAELRAENEQLKNAIVQQKRIEDALRVAERDYRTIFQSTPVGFFRTSPEGRYLKCNPALAHIYGYDSPEDLTSNVYDIKRRLYVEQDSRERFIRGIQQSDQIAGFEARVYRKDGSIIWISETARAVRGSDGAIVHYEGFVADITTRKQAEERMRESEERYALAMRGANDGIWDWNLREGLIYFSTRWKEMLGATEEQVGNLPEEWFNRVHPDDLLAVKSAIAAHRDGTTPHFEIEHRMRHTDGRYRWMLSRGLATRDGAGVATRMAGSQTDITSRKEAEEQLLRDALHDGLTGLPNRVLFLERLERSIARTTRDPGHTFAALFLDMDRFKVINDSLGHAFGDQLLVEFGKRVSACVRPSDTVARLGGDEFTVLLEDPSEPYDAVGVADRILEAVRKPFVLGVHEVFVTTSIGITTSDTGYSRPQDVLRDADTALYRAKALGKAQAQTFDVSMHARAVKLLQIENDLRRAIDRNEFVLYYQPILRIGSGEVYAFEALLRWRHPERGLVPPVDFIPIAEETGLIMPIGKWVLNEACRQAAEWLAQYPGTPINMNVNLSGKQFSQNDLIEQVTSALRQTGLPPQHLTLEITESVVMEHPETAILMLERLKELGIKLNIDDFGTGYSSLAYLQRFPVDTMKIDRSFVNRMTEGAESAEIVRTIVTLAHNLNMHVTAEGIETAEQLAQLKNLDCENAQGYYLSRPIEATAAGEFLKKSKPPASST
jgi:diguanylate cyclase (GGDEF)-like protein/PAS domain S-box-containing protein